MEKQIRCEVDNGRYVVTSDKPVIVSALAAIPKGDGQEIRLVHDASKPLGSALNDYAINSKFRYQTLQEAARLIQRQDYIAKVDLASAYRSVKVHEADWPLTGLAWKFEGDENVTYLQDKRLPFGARLSAGIFNTLTQAVRRILAEEGHRDICVYLDDFLIRGATKEECTRSMNRLLVVLRELGFAISYKKVVPPTQCLTFLGIEIDTVDYVFRLPTDKLSALKSEVGTIKGRRSASKEELESLAGRMNWAAQAVLGARTFMRRIIDRINILKYQHHRTRITGGLAADLRWWSDYLVTFNGHIPLLDHRSYIPVAVDACKSGCGGVFQDSIFHLNWDYCPDVKGKHINHLEVLALEPAVRLWGPSWQDSVVHVYSDNQVAVSAINKGSSKDPHVMNSLRSVFWACALFNFKLKAIYYPGVRNTLADRASRLSEPGGPDELEKVWAQACRAGQYGCPRARQAGQIFYDTGLLREH